MTVLLTSIIQITIKLSKVWYFITKVNDDKYKQGILSGINNIGDIDSGNKNLSNLSMTRKSKFLTKFKKLDLVKIYSYTSDFLTFKAKKAFIHSWKIFIQISIIFI